LNASTPYQEMLNPNDYFNQQETQRMIQNIRGMIEMTQSYQNFQWFR
jgi:hypothetical protein